MNILGMADPLKSMEKKPAVVTAEVAAALDEFCSQVRTALGDEKPDLQALSAAMLVLAKWSAGIRKEPAKTDGRKSAWQAEFFGIPAMGGSLTCTKGRRALLLSLDAEGRPLHGALEEDENDTIFQVEESGGSVGITFEKGGIKRNITLPGGGQNWGSLDAFLQSLPARPMSAPSPAADAPAAGLVPEETTRCLKCGSALKPGARFCGKCGEPATAAKIKTCPVCGKTLSPSARFCGKCGSRQD